MTNLVVFIDDPIISTSLGELIIQLQSGLTMGSRGAGVSKPEGSLLLTSNDTVVPRAEGRVLVFEYVKEAFSSEDERILERGVKAIASENPGFLLSWAITFKHIWERQMQVSFDVLKDTLASLLPEMQPRWVKGMATVISTHAIFHASAGICPNTVEAVREVVSQNKTFKKEHVLVRLQASMMSKLETDMSNEVSDHLKAVTEATGSISMMFAIDETCTVSDCRKRNLEKAKMAKGLKVPMALLNPEVISKIKDRCGIQIESEASGPTAGPSQEMEAPSNSSGVDPFSTQLNLIDNNLMTFFKEYVQSSNQQDDTHESTDNFTENLTPESKKQWSSFSPHSREVFKKGFALGKRTTGADNSQNSKASVQPEAVDLCTPSTSGSNNAETGLTRKRLFPEGTFGVLPRHKKDDASQAGKRRKDGDKSVVCSSCKKANPRKGMWSGEWVQCDECDKWLHKECAKLRTLPKETEPFVCSKCKQNK